MPWPTVIYDGFYRLVLPTNDGAHSGASIHSDAGMINTLNQHAVVGHRLADQQELVY